MTATTRDPFQPYDAAAKKPKVPEASAYGFIFMGLLLLVIWARRKK